MLRNYAQLRALADLLDGRSGGLCGRGDVLAVRGEDGVGAEAGRDHAEGPVGVADAVAAAGLLAGAGPPQHPTGAAADADLVGCVVVADEGVVGPSGGLCVPRVGCHAAPPTGCGRLWICWCAVVAMVFDEALPGGHVVGSGNPAAVPFTHGWAAVVGERFGPRLEG